MAKVPQIKSVPLTRLSLSLHAAFHQSVKELIEKYTAAALHIEPQYSVYSESVAEVLNISTRQTTYVTTSQIGNGSKAQLNSVGVLLNCVKAHLTSTLPVKAEAAISLDAVLSPFFGMRKRKYAEATLDIQTMIALLRKEEPMGWIKTLKLEEELDEAEVRNNFMRSVIALKSAEIAARTAQSDVESGEARKTADNGFNDFVTVVNAYAVVSPSEVNSNFITDLNGIIENYKMHIDAASTSTPTVDPTPDASTETTPDGGSSGTDTTPDTGEEDDGTTPPATDGDDEDEGEVVG